jgi:hypothetical protein
MHARAAVTHSSDLLYWDDLRSLLAVACLCSNMVGGAASGADLSTMQHRFAELEQRVDQSLVQRQATGYRLTDFGHFLSQNSGRFQEFPSNLGLGPPEMWSPFRYIKLPHIVPPNPR